MVKNDYFIKGDWWADNRRPWLEEFKNPSMGYMIDWYWKRFKYENSTAEKERFVYFGLFGRDHDGFDYGDRYKRPNFQTESFYKNLINKWVKIFKSAADLQRKNENDFLKNSDYYLKDLKDDPLLSDYVANIKTEKDTTKQLTNFFQTVLINEEIGKMFEGLDEKIIQKAFQTGLQNFIFKKIETKQEAKKATEDFYESVLDILITNVSKQRPGLQQIMSKLKNSSAAVEILKTLGYIREESYSGKKRIIMRFFNKDETLSQKDFDNFKSSYIGVREELIRLLAVGLKGNKNIKVDYLGTTGKEKSSAYQKTDIKIGIPGDRGKIPDFNINFSVKSANFADSSSFVIPAKLVGEGSLATRYQEIFQELEKFGGRSGKDDLNKLFYSINNELIRRNTNLDIPEILNVLAFVSMRYMFNMEDFQEIEKKQNKKNLNFFLIGGKVVPFSIVFELMSDRLKQDALDRSKDIVSVSLKPPTKSITYQYYLARKNNKIPFVENQSARRSAWEWGRDFVEDNGKMAFYLKTNQIFKIFNLKNI